MDPKKIEKIPSIRNPPWWRPPINTQIKDKEQAMVTPPTKSGELQIHMDGSVIDGKVGAAINAYWNDERWLIDGHHSGTDNDYAIFEAELLAIYIAIKTAAKRNGIRKLTIYCDSQAAIQALKNNTVTAATHLLDAIHAINEEIKHQVNAPT